MSVLSPGEFRAIRLNQDGIEQVLEAFLHKLLWKKFRLSPGSGYSILWHHDRDWGEVYLLAHRTADFVRRGPALAFCRQQEPLDSLLEDQKAPYYRVYRRLPFVHPGKPRSDRQLRVIRLDTLAVQELIWEHMMELPTEPEEIVCMSVDPRLKAVSVYIMLREEWSDERTEEIAAWCRENLTATDWENASFSAGRL